MHTTKERKSVVLYRTRFALLVPVFALLLLLALHSLLLAPPAMAESGATAQTGSITGHVEYVGSAVPAESVKVVAYDASGTPQGSSYTDATGQYTITSLAPASYRIRFGAPSFDDPRSDNHPYVNEYYSNRTIFEQADWVTVTTGLIPDINAALIARQSSDLRLATASSRANVLLVIRYGRLGFRPLYTLDGGQSWHRLKSEPLENYQDAREIALAPKDDLAQSVRFLIAPRNFVSTADALYRTGDEGASWASFVPPHDLRCDSSSRLNTVVASPADPQRLYALTSCSRTEMLIEPIHFHYVTLYASKDGGVNWQAVSAPLTEDGLDDFEFPFAFLEDSFQPSPVEPARIYARVPTYTPANTWRRSDNGGQSWITDTFTLSVVTLDWANANKLYGVEDVGGENLFRYTGKRSTNLGASWEAWGQQPCRTSFRQLISLPTPDTLMMLCNQGLYRSNNGGDSWTFLTTESGGTLWTHSGDRDLVLWVRGVKLYGSRDQGATWIYLGVWQDGLYLPSVRRP